MIEKIQIKIKNVDSKLPNRRAPRNYATGVKELNAAFNIVD